MTNPIEKKLLKTPVEERRGVWTTWDADSWEATLVKSDFDALMRRLTQSVGEGVGGVVSDQTEAILKGEQPAPDGLWYLVVELAGSPWLHIAHGYRAFNHLNQLVKIAQAPVLRTGHQDTAGATYAFIEEGDEQTLMFESTGMKQDEDDEFDEFEEFEMDHDGSEEEDPFEVPLRFETKLLPADWPDQFDSEDLLQQALMRELDAYVPMIGAGAQDGHIQVWAGHEDVLKPEYVKNIGLVLVGQERSAMPDPANRQLLEVLRACDPSAVSAAIAAGASLSHMPGFESSPLRYIMSVYQPETSKLKDIVDLLLDAGADPDDGGGGEDAPLFAAIDKYGRNPALSSELCVKLLDAGASATVFGSGLNAGQTPIHKAANDGHLPLIKILHQHGADLSVKDARGRTPREALVDTIERMVEYMGEDAEEYVGGSREVLAYLETVESGDPTDDDWQSELDDAQKKATRQQRKMKVAFGRAGEAFKQLGEQLKRAEDDPAPERQQEGQGASVQDVVEMVGKEAARSFVSEGLSGIELEPDESEWGDPKQRDKQAVEFESLGFEPVGSFVVSGIVPTRVMAFVNTAEQWYGVIYEPSGQSQFADIVRLHNDESLLTVTSNKQAAPYELDRFRKVRLPGQAVGKLVQQMREEAVPEVGLAPVSAESFVGHVKWATAEEGEELRRSLE
jgi:hypothetical protein